MDNCYLNYSKEAQKCFCGTEKCRGTIGINKSTPLKSKKKPAEQEEDKEDLFQEEDVRIILQFHVSNIIPQTSSFTSDPISFRSRTGYGTQ